MGASQSTRKITLINDDKAGVIKLSESLAHRLRGQIEGQQAAAASAVEKGSQETQEPLQDIEAAPSSQSLTSAPAPPVPPHLAPPEPVLPPQVPLETPTFSEPSIPAVAPDLPANAAKPTLPEDPLPPAKSELEEPPPAATATFEVPLPPPPPSEPVTTPEVAPEQPKLILPPEIEIASTEVSASAVEAPTVPSEDVAPAAVSVPALAESIAEAMVQGSADVPSHTQALVSSVAAPLPAAPAASTPDVGTAIQAVPRPTLTHPSGSIPPWSIYAEEAHLLVMRLREEKEQELQTAEKTWRDKLDKREEEFTNIGKLTQEQFNASLKEVESMFLKATCTPVCQDQQEEVMKCYQDHPKQSLRCSREVAQFTQCVDLTRLQAVMKQHPS